MIRCLLFGHTPHPKYERLRIGRQRLTHCKRCMQPIIEIVDSDRPLPPGVLTPEERDAVLIDSLIDRLIPALTPYLLKRKRSTRKPKAESAAVADTAGGR